MDRTAAITEKANNAQKVLDNDIIKQTKAYKDGHIAVSYTHLDVYKRQAYYRSI